MSGAEILDYLTRGLEQQIEINKHYDDILKAGLEAHKLHVEHFEMLVGRIKKLEKEIKKLNGGRDERK